MDGLKLAIHCGGCMIDAQKVRACASPCIAPPGQGVDK